MMMLWSLQITKYSGDGVNPACFLSNQNSKLNGTIDYEGSTYFLPAWSVSILPDCKSEVYNTAKVITATSTQPFACFLLIHLTSCFTCSSYR